jgi:glycosyltransferase involved in cell wall biosynthesis
MALTKRMDCGESSPTISASPCKPRALWFKSRMPGVVNDGTSAVTLHLADCLRSQYEIDLVTMDLTGNEAKVSPKICPPFSRVFIVPPNNAGSWIKRGCYRIYNEVRSWIGGLPRSVLITSCHNARMQLVKLFESEKYAVAIFEYYNSAPLLEVANCPTALLLIDATFQTLAESTRTKSGLSRMIAVHQANAMRRFETRVAALASACFAISPRDIELLNEGGNKNPIRHLPVVFPPLRYKTPRRRDELAAAGPIIAYLGNLNYEENRRGIEWFLESVFPRVRSQVPNAVLRLFGGAADRLPDKLRRLAGVEPRGWVGDLQSALAECACGIAPSVSGTGVKIKVLEMQWHGLPVVMTQIAAAGIGNHEGVRLVAATANDFAAHVVSLLTDRDVRTEAQEAVFAALDRHHCGDNLRTRIQETFHELEVQ